MMVDSLMVLLAAILGSLVSLLGMRIKGRTDERTADLAEKVAWLRDHPDEAARIGRNARALAEREFSRDELAGRALALLEEAAR